MPALRVVMLSSARQAKKLIDYIFEPGKILGRRMNGLPEEPRAAANVLEHERWRAGLRAGAMMHMIVSFPDGTPVTVTEAFDYWDRLMKRAGLANQPSAVAAHEGRPHLHGAISRVLEDGTLLPVRIDRLVELERELSAYYGLDALGPRNEPIPATVVNAETWEGTLSFTRYLKMLPWPKPSESSAVEWASIEALLTKADVRVVRTRGGWRLEHPDGNGGFYRAKASRCLPDVARHLLRAFEPPDFGRSPLGYRALLAEGRIVLPVIKRGDRWEEVQAANQRSAKGLGYWHRRLTLPDPTWTADDFDRSPRSDNLRRRRRSEDSMITFAMTGDPDIDERVHEQCEDKAFLLDLEENLAKVPTTKRIIAEREVFFGRDHLALLIRKATSRQAEVLMPGVPARRSIVSWKYDGREIRAFELIDPDSTDPKRPRPFLRLKEDGVYIGGKSKGDGTLAFKPGALPGIFVSSKQPNARVFVAMDADADVDTVTAALRRELNENQLNYLRGGFGRIEGTRERAVRSELDRREQEEREHPFEADDEHQQSGADPAERTNGVVTPGEDEREPFVIAPGDAPRREGAQQRGNASSNGHEPTFADEMAERDRAFRKVFTAYAAYLEGLGLAPETVSSIVTAEQRSVFAWRALNERMREHVSVGRRGHKEVIEALRGVRAATREAGFAVIAAQVLTGSEVLSISDFTHRGPDELRKAITPTEMGLAHGRGSQAHTFGPRPLLIGEAFDRLRVDERDIEDGHGNKERVSVFSIPNAHGPAGEFIEREDGYHFARDAHEIASDALRAALLLAAQEDHGAVKLSGSRQFREMAAALAVELGIPVQGDRRSLDRIDAEVAARKELQPKAHFDDDREREAFLARTTGLQAVNVSEPERQENLRLTLQQKGVALGDGRTTFLAVDERGNERVGVLRLPTHPPRNEQDVPRDIEVGESFLLTFDDNHNPHTEILDDERSRDGRERDGQQREREREGIESFAR